MKVSDYIIDYLTQAGITDIFMISGGGAMHLVDSVGKNKRIRYWCPHHEQAAAIAAEGYFRVNGKMCAVVVTSGPGGTNTLTGVIGQWLDSIPAIYISGQVKQETTIDSCKDLDLRQLGDQEINIVDIVAPVTKYAVQIKDPYTIRYHLDKAFHLALKGRGGPCWLDIPLDIQGAEVDTDTLEGCTIEDESFDKNAVVELAAEVASKIANAKRPVIVAGHGIRLSGAIDRFEKLCNRLGIPCLGTFNGMDLLKDDNPCFAGRIGTVGDRGGNFTIQNADLMISIGSRNNIRQISYGWETYAKDAKKIIVDIDRGELSKPTLKADVKIHSDAGFFMEALENALDRVTLPDFSEWLGWCRDIRKRYPVLLERHKKTTGCVNHYHFADTLTKRMKEDAVVVAGNGTACVCLFQAAHICGTQRLFWNSGCASMGYDLPAAVGAQLAEPKRQVIALAGDGSMQMNIQELETIGFNKLPIKIFYLDNRGYLSIKQTQDSFFSGNRVACDSSSGVGFPDIEKIAGAYGITYMRIDDPSTLGDVIDEALSLKSSCIVQVVLDPEAVFEPKLSSERLPDGTMVSKPLHDMFPFIDPEELKRNMIGERQ